MVDERGEKMQMVEEGRKRKYEITTSLLTGELVAADMAFLTRREDFIEKFSVVLGFLSLLAPPRDPLVDFGAFSMNTVMMDLTLS
jgi:hypothetical protein